MFRGSWNSRYVLRGALAATLVALATLRSSIGDGMSPQEWLDLVQNTLAAAAAYYGLGAAFPAVEPFVGNTLDGAAVPEPPADPEPPK